VISFRWRVNIVLTSQTYFRHSDLKGSLFAAFQIRRVGSFIFNTARWCSKEHGVCPMPPVILKRYFYPNIIWMTLIFISKRLSQATFKKKGPNIRVTTLTFLGHVMSSVTWPIDPPYAISYYCLTGTEHLSSTVFKIFASKYIWVTTLTFQGHVTSSVTWPFDSPGAISYRRVSNSSHFRANGPKQIVRQMTPWVART